MFASIDHTQVISNENTAFLPQWIVEKLAKRNFIPLYHFLPEARAEALAAARAHTADGAYILEKDEDGGIGIRQRSEMASSKKVIPDNLLTWSQILIAKNVLMDAFSRASWADDHIASWAGFYANLGCHDLHQEPGGELLLVRYHAEARLKWHDQLVNFDIAFDISHISQPRLDALEGQMRRENDIIRANDHAQFQVMSD